MLKSQIDDKGFTLLEMMVAIAIASIVMTAIYATHRSQLRSHLTQQSMADMHQNARGAMFLMKNEIQMAGYDPTKTANARILIATSTDFQFEMDLNGDGDCTDGGEVIRFLINAGNLQRAIDAGAPALLAENVDALDFAYFDDGMNLIDLSTPLTETQMAAIRLVQVTMVARADNPVFAYKQTDNKTYTNNQGTAILVPADYAGNATARRARLSTSVWCRNMGKV